MKIQIIGGPTLTPAQKAALREENQRIDDTYPGHNVAYIDEWDGDTLRRTVVAAAVGAEPFHRLLVALEPLVRKRVQLTRVPDADAFFVPHAV